MSVEALRTPDERFRSLPGYDYTPHYIEDLPGYQGLRIHYVDEGPGNAPRTFLCLHGQPTWAYLYRKMIPVFLETGARVVAPDFLGFGRSDKPVDEDVYTFDFHRDMALAFIKQLDLRHITLVCQDWGGLIGLTLPMEMPERFERLIVMNTALALGTSPGPGFEAWKAYNAANPDLDIAGLMRRATSILGEEEAAAYSAPFPDQRYKAGVRRFPELVMVSSEMDGVDTSRRAADWWSNAWTGESFMAIGMADPVLGAPAMESLRKRIRGCPEPMKIEAAGHFVQEWGEDIARTALQRWGDFGPE